MKKMVIIIFSLLSIGILLYFIIINKDIGDCKELELKIIVFRNSDFRYSLHLKNKNLTTEMGKGNLIVKPYSHEYLDLPEIEGMESQKIYSQNNLSNEEDIACFENDEKMTKIHDGDQKIFVMDYILIKKAERKINENECEVFKRIEKKVDNINNFLNPEYKEKIDEIYGKLRDLNYIYLGRDRQPFGVMIFLKKTHIIFRLETGVEYSKEVYAIEADVLKIFKLSPIEINLDNLKDFKLFFMASDM